MENIKALSNNLKISNKKLYQIMDMEFNKPEDEVNVALINFCSAILNARHEKKKHIVPTFTLVKSSHKRIKKAVLIATVSITLFLGIYTGSTTEFKSNFKNIFYNNTGNAVYINTNTAHATPSNYLLLDTDLAKHLEQNGITPITVPEVFVNGMYPLTDLSISTNNDTQKSAAIDIRDKKNHKKIGSFTIDKNINNGSMVTFEISNVQSGMEVMVNGIDVLIFKRNGSYSIFYRDQTNLTQYSIQIKASYDEIMQIVKSIK